jgi:hypothetical protein
MVPMSALSAGTDLLGHAAPGGTCGLVAGCDVAALTVVEVAGQRSTGCPAHAVLTLRATPGAAVELPASPGEFCPDCLGTCVIGGASIDDQVSTPYHAGGRAAPTVCPCSWDVLAESVPVADVLAPEDWPAFCASQGLDPADYEAFCAWKGLRPLRRKVRRRPAGVIDVHLSPAVAE